MTLLAERIRLARTNRGWGQRELARRCGLGEAQIYKYEHEQAEPVASNLAIIAEQLGVSADYLLGRTDDPNQHVGYGQITDEERAVLETLRREGWAGIAHLGVDRMAKDLAKS
jgi:transcriptional regulator with XRE-family HTH domain